MLLVNKSFHGTVAKSIVRGRTRSQCGGRVHSPSAISFVFRSTSRSRCTIRWRRGLYLGKSATRFATIVRAGFRVPKRFSQRFRGSTERRPHSQSGGKAKHVICVGVSTCKRINRVEGDGPNDFKRCQTRSNCVERRQVCVSKIVFSEGAERSVCATTVLSLPKRIPQH